MHIRHQNPATATLGFGGHEFATVRPNSGIFDVPDEIGHELLQHGVWTRYRGEPATAIGAESEEPPASDVADLIDWFREGLEAAKRGDPRTIPPGVHQASREAREWRHGWDSLAPE